MVIQNSIVSISFPKIENVKKKYIVNEDVLRENFNEATILPIPEELPNDIPRIVAVSHGEHSQIRISPNTVNFQTEYSNGYEKSWEECESYINSRVEGIFKLTDQLTDHRYNYMGMIVNLIWDDIQHDANKKLYQNILKKEATSNLEDFNIKFTYIEKEKFYVNVMIENIRSYKEFELEKAGACKPENLTADTISVTLDINDRYSFQKQEDYLSDNQKFKEIMNLMTYTIKNKLRDLIEKGEY